MHNLMTVVLFLLLFLEDWGASSDACPTHCLCMSEIQVLCNMGNLTHIPTNFPLETQEIIITNQNIREVPSNIFSHLKDLRRLVLDSNNISIIRPFAFKDLKDMVEISLQNNPITVLGGFAFAGIRNVTNIYLGYNRLQRIDGNAFAGTEHIQMLVLNNNPIKVVNSSAFSGLKSIEFLFLPAGVQTLSGDAFNGLEQVGMLKLAYLDLTELAAFTFRGLRSVRTLTIENSDLATIRERAFHGMERIGELRIANNKIDRIEDLSIPNEVRNLTLVGNHVLEIPSLKAMSNINVKGLRVEQNHFPCNCRVLLLLESPLGSRQKDFMRVNKCISPFNLNGRPMVDMSQIGILQQCRRQELELEEQQREKEWERRRNDRRDKYVGATEVSTTAISSSDHRPRVEEKESGDDDSANSSRISLCGRAIMVVTVVTIVNTIFLA